MPIWVNGSRFPIFSYSCPRIFSANCSWMWFLMLHCYQGSDGWQTNQRYIGVISDEIKVSYLIFDFAVYWRFQGSASFVGPFLMFMFDVCLCYAVLSARCSLVDTCWKSSFVCCFMFVFVMLSCLLVVALWSPAEKGLTSLLSCVLCFLVFCHLPIWFPK